MATGDSLNVAEVCYKLGKCYSGIGDYVTAHAWFIRSLRIREPLGYSESIGRTYLRTAENRIRQNQYQEAMRDVRRAVVNFQHSQSRHGMMSADIVLASVYELGWQLNHEKSGVAAAVSLDSSLYYFRRAERLALALNKPYDVANVYACMGRAIALRDGKQAIPYLEKSYLINLSENSPYGIINSLQQLATCYLAIGEPRTAKKWLDKATYVRDTARHGEYGQNRVLEETYAKIYEQTGQWQQAFVHQRNYYRFQVATLEEDRAGAISRMTMRYDNEKKEAQLRAQQQELALRHENLKVQQRLTFMSTLSFILTGVACIVFYWLFKKYRRISEHNAKLVKEQNHRVKNNLQSITSLLSLQFNRLIDPVAKQAVEESLLRVEAMALVHQRLYDGDRLVEIAVNQFIPELVEGVLRSYSLGNVRPTYSLSPVWIDADVAINIGLLLNELVTNSCKYALPFCPQPALNVGFQDVNGRFRVWVTDNGPGFVPSSKSSSFGMKLIAMITEKLKGKGIFSTKNGSRFTLSFDPQVLTKRY